MVASVGPLRRCMPARSSDLTNDPEALKMRNKCGVESMSDPKAVPG